MAADEKQEIYSATALIASATGTARIGTGNYIDRYLEVQASSVTGTPTFDINVEHSSDGTNWYIYKTFAQITANSTELIALTDPSLKHLRADVTVAGTTPSADLIVNIVRSRQ
jgi:hypothetical protein